MSGHGSLIVVEGADGVGKSTLTQELVTQLRAIGFTCYSYAFPGNETGTLGELVYKLHHDPAKLGLNVLSLTALQAMHIAAHLDAIERVFLPRLVAGEHIIVDRYWWSTWVYGVVGGASRKVLKALIEAERRCWGAHAPLVIFLVDRNKPWRVKEETPGWHRLAEEYRNLARRRPKTNRVEIVSNDAPPDQVVAGMAKTIMELLALPSSQHAMQPELQMRLDMLNESISPSRQSSSISLRRIGGVKPTAIFDTYWRFAAERQNVFFRRLKGTPPPWSADIILQQYRFTNAYRASDRVSQYLIHHVIYEGDQQPDDSSSGSFSSSCLTGSRRGSCLNARSVPDRR